MCTILYLDRAEGGSAAQQYILATGMSDRHVAASVAAVRWQLKERLAELGESVQPLVRMEVPAVVGSAESEWCCLDAGGCCKLKQHQLGNLIALAAVCGLDVPNVTYN